MGWIGWYRYHQGNLSPRDALLRALYGYAPPGGRGKSRSSPSSRGDGKRAAREAVKARIVGDRMLEYRHAGDVRRQQLIDANVLVDYEDIGTW